VPARKRQCLLPLERQAGAPHGRSLQQG
jgi:hypothetical protein